MTMLAVLAAVALSLAPDGSRDRTAYYSDRTAPDECLELAVRYGIPRIMVVPPDFTDGKENEADAKGRIGHVHLKDQAANDNRAYVTLGLGAVPNGEIVKAMSATGYEGWYTLENPVGDTYLDTVRQVAVLKVWLREGGAK